MTVKELIELLKKCPQDSIVMYSMETSLDNDNLEIREQGGGLHSEVDFDIDDALICNGTMRGFVLLTADALERGNKHG